MSRPLNKYDALWYGAVGAVGTLFFIMAIWTIGDGLARDGWRRAERCIRFGIACPNSYNGPKGCGL